MKKKLLISFFCLLFILVFNFALPRLLPGDTVLMLVGMDEDVVSENEYAYYVEKTGADRPLAEQFASYLRGILQGDLGYSYHHNAPVGQLIAQRVPATLQIALPAVLLSALLALVLGCYAGMRKGSGMERMISTLQITVDAIPGFLLGLLLLSLFAFHLGWFPSGALNSIVVPAATLPAWGDRIWHLCLPVLTLVLGSVPAKYLLVCNTVAQQMQEKYVLYARSRGLSDSYIVWHHILPNICQPFIAMVGMNMGFIFSGSLVIETIFSIRGLGSLLDQAIRSRDYPLLQGCLLVSAVVVVVANLLTDVLCVALDPKVRCRIHEAE